MEQGAPEDVTLMFGVGATKAGTSWLYRYLSGHPDCAMPRIKELHYFNRRTAEAQVREMARIADLRAALAGKPKQAETLADLDRWAGVIAQPGEDAAAYVGFLRHHAGPQTRLVGDVTPAYALLSADKLRQMAGLLATTRFVYLLRDPLDRLWSNIRMMAGWRTDADGHLGDKALELFDTFLGGGLKPVAARSDYRGALKRLDDGVGAERLHVAFYEDLFNQAAIDRLCGFLGIAPHPADFDKKVHKSGRASLDGPRAAKARDLLAPQYDYIQSRLGDLPARWQENRMVLT